MGLSLLPYQEEGVKVIASKGGRALIGDEMGLGKTAQALTYLARNKKYPLVAICEATAKENWSREISMWTGKRAYVCHGSTPPDDGALSQNSAYVINYNILNGWVDYFKKRGVKDVILDECHNLAGEESKRTEACRHLVRGGDSLLALSGTPLTNKPLDLFPVLNMLRPDVWPSRFAFMQRYCKPVLRHYGWTATGAENLDELNLKIKKHVLLRRRKADVLKDFPAKNRVTVNLAIDEMETYQAAKNDFMKWLKEHQRGGQLAAAKKAPALYQVGELVRLACKLKLRASVGWVNRFLEENPEEKLIVYLVHTEPLRVFQRRVNAPFISIDGSTPTRKRQGLVDQFNNDSKTRLAILNILAAGASINMVSCCHTYFGEMWWAPHRHTQAEDRTHRIGQKRTCWAYYGIASGTIEEKIALTLHDKQQLLARSMDGDREVGEINVHENLVSAFAMGLR